jgi:hypothetical protein
MKPEREKQLIDTFPGSHIEHTETGDRFKPGSWFVSHDPIPGGREQDRLWVIHRLNGWSHGPASSDSELICEYFTADCGRFAHDGGPVNRESAQYVGYAVDTADEVKRLKASFCDNCFPEEPSENKVIEDWTYQKVLTALVIREIAAKRDIDGNALAEEAKRIIREDGTVNIATRIVDKPQETLLK